MKTKKIISLFAAVAMVATMFSSLAAFAATPAADSKPELQAAIVDVDSDGYAIIQVKLVNKETLVPYSTGRKGMTINGINAIQAKVYLDEDVFDVEEAYIISNVTGSLTSGNGTKKLIYVFAPSSPDTYLTAVPEYIFRVEALLKDGYNKDIIPSSAIKIDNCAVEYTKYDASELPTTYTIYGVGEEVPTKDYTLVTKADATFVENELAMDETFKNTDGTYNAGIKGSVTAAANTKGIKFSFKDNKGHTADHTVTFGTDVVSAGTTVSAGLNITSVPADVVLTLTGKTAVTE